MRFWTFLFLTCLLAGHLEAAQPNIPLADGDDIRVGEFRGDETKADGVLGGISGPIGHRAACDQSAAVLPAFEFVTTESDAPATKQPPPSGASKSNKNSDQQPVSNAASTPGLPWGLAFEDHYEGRSEIGKDYATSRGHEDAWTVVDGVLVGKQTKSDHGAVIRTAIDFDDVDIQFDFRFSGGTRFNFVIDDKGEKSVHAGHICRVSISPKRLSISDDKTGGMNLEVRKMRRDSDRSPEDSKRLQEILARTQSDVPVNLQPGEWHTLRVRMEGDTMTAFLDGKRATSLRSPGFAHPTKTKFGFTVNGATVDFDNLKVLTANGPAGQ